MIKVLSKADGEKVAMQTNVPMPYHVLATLHSARRSYLPKWASDLFHVAMRIRAVEEGTPDPDTLIITQADRYAKIADNTYVA